MIQLSMDAMTDVFTGNPAILDPIWLATDLTARGYALVAVSGAALHTAAEDLESLPPAEPEQAERIEVWFDPSRVS